MISLNNDFSKQYRDSVDSVSLPENYEEKILFNLRQVASPEDKNNEIGNKRAYKFTLSLIAAALVVTVGLSVFFSVLSQHFSEKEVTLRIVSATNLCSVSGARVVFVNSSGEFLKDENGDAVTVVSDEQGFATATIPAKEDYTAQISMNGYIPLEERAQSGNYYISPVMDENTYRAVLTWEKECDLDAHLSITTEKGTDKLYYFESDITDENGVVIAALDVDSETSKNPETITFNADRNMLCRFSVGSYSALKNDDDNMFSQTGAKVTLYKGEECIGTYSIGKNPQGNVWCVFEIVNGEVRVCDYTYSVSTITEIE